MTHLAKMTDERVACLEATPVGWWVWLVLRLPLLVGAARLEGACFGWWVRLCLRNPLLLVASREANKDHLIFSAFKHRFPFTAWPTYLGRHMLKLGTMQRGKSVFPDM